MVVACANNQKKGHRAKSMRDIGFQRAGVASVKNGEQAGPYGNKAGAKGPAQQKFRFFIGHLCFAGHQIHEHTRPLLAFFDTGLADVKRNLSPLSRTNQAAYSDFPAFLGISRAGRAA